MVSFKLLAVSSVAGVAIAHPQPTPAPYLEERTDCAKVNGALSILKKLGPPATSFCSSYLKVPMTKTLTTTTTPVVTSATSTTTITVTSSICPAAANPVRRAVTPGKPFSVYWDGSTTRIIEKRTDNILPLVAAFAAAKVSDGCNCLGIQPKATTTKTVAAATSTVKVVATSTACVPSCIADGATCQSSGTACCNSASICNLATGLLTGTCGPPPPPASVCHPIGGSCTIDNFVDVCCGNADGSKGCLFPDSNNTQDGTCFI